MGQNRFKEIRKRPSEKTRRRRRAIRSATIEVLQDRPYFVSPLGQATVIVLHLRQRAVASFDGRRGALKGSHALAGPCLPLLKGLAGKPLGEHVGVKRRLARLQRLTQLGFPAGTACVRHVVGPRDVWEEVLPGLHPPGCRQARVLHILLNTCPPEVHQGRHGRQWLADLAPGTLTGQELMLDGQRFYGVHLRVQSTGDLRGRLRGGVVDVEGMEGE